MVLFVSLAAGVSSLAWGYAEVGLAVQTRWLVVLGIVWIIAQAQRVRWVASLGLLVSVAAAAYGLWLELSAGWMLAGAVGALFAWDLSEFERRVHLADLDDDKAGMERRHLLRLTFVAGAGFLFSLIGMLVRLQFTFEWTAFLAILSALGVTQLVRGMRREEKG
jgi:hypothetical protein